MRRSRFDDNTPARRGRRRFDDEDHEPAPHPHTPDLDASDDPADGDRWSTWDLAQHGPRPHPDWLVTELAAVDTGLGVLKTGKEADVHLLERAVPGTARSCVLAAKRYRSAEHRMFHRDAAYLEGRRVRRSRETRAMARRTAFGRDLLAGQWAAAEFSALCRLWQIGAPVPYPVQLHGTELLLEYLDEEDGQAAPRLAQLRPGPAQLHELWNQLIEAMTLLVDEGLAHGDLSPFNLLVHRGRLVLIDLPQVVDIVANPQGPAFLARDIRNVTDWFTARGLPRAVIDADTSRLWTPHQWR
ncbi:MAG TPA: RIO1 family regulatory kinase/ATPase [Pseudonocardiaceae bacterium]|nr:RIO1 family regulatory kinase/ATPase [Pseudonocardiaceae bacterium]